MKALGFLYYKRTPQLSPFKGTTHFSVYRLLSYHVNLGPGWCPIGQWSLIIISLLKLRLMVHEGLMEGTVPIFKGERG